MIVRTKVFEFCNDHDEITRLTGEKEDRRKDESEAATAALYN